MASPAKQIKRIRKKKLVKGGKSRKAEIRKNGTTKSKTELFGDDK
ncbi:MAG: hypothetical protein AB8E15_03975 [Bdellovibrionales bacterium]